MKRIKSFNQGERVLAIATVAFVMLNIIKACKD